MNHFCQYCESTFSREVSLQRHLRQCKNIPTEKCNVCSDNIRITHKEEHMKEHIPKPKYRYCKYCDDDNININRITMKDHFLLECTYNYREEYGDGNGDKLIAKLRAEIVKLRKT